MYRTQGNDIISNIIFIPMFFYVIFKQNDQFFLPFSVNYSEVAIFQIMPALCPHGRGEEERWSTKCGQAWTGGGGPKNSQICADILYG